VASRFKLKLDLVPGPLWGVNLRSPIHGLGKGRWTTFRKRLVATSDGNCVICGSSEKLHGHEVWRYEEKKRVGKATLERVEIICWTCHNIAHWGKTVQLYARGVISHEGFMVLRRHFRRLNRCRQVDFDRHSRRALAIWKRRSKLRWRVDWGPFASAVAQAKAARAAWRERQAPVSYTSV
jgi:hypothetical protein